MDKVVVGMSGGIDSSMTAYLLKKSGYDVVGVTLMHLSSEYTGQDSAFAKDLSDAKAACFHIGIPHYLIDVREKFQNEVVKYFIDEYQQGRTPSPCVVCDEKIKMKSLADTADRLGIKYIATGHYSKVFYCEELDSYVLRNSKDLKKDQSYMLYRLDQSIIKRMLLPLSDYKKEEIREMAQEIGFDIHSKKDSQGICFAPNGYIHFLRKSLGSNIKEGDFVDKEGRIMGKHKGYQFYTIGQRRGLNLKLPRAYFVTEIRPASNEIVLGEFEELRGQKILLENTKFVTNIKNILNVELRAKARFSSRGLKGSLLVEVNEIYFVYNEPNCECAPGQHMVFTYKDMVVGGGIIKGWLKR